MLRTTLYFVLISVATVTFYWSDLIVYGLRQLQGQLNIVIQAVPVEKIMTHEVVTIGLKSRMADAAKLMLEYKISGLPVVNEVGEVVGVITESDIFRMVIQNETVNANIS